MGDKGIGPRGEVEYTTTNWETQVKIPMALTFRAVMLTWMGVLAVYGCGYAISWRAYDGPFLATYRYTLGRRSLGPCWLRGALDFTARNWPIMAIPLVASAVFWSIRFLRRYIIPKQNNPNWPPPYAQADPLDAGAAGYYDWPTYDDGEAPEPPQPQERWLNVQITNGEHSPGLPDIGFGRIPEPRRDERGGIAGLCRDIMNGTATLSWDGGEGQRGVKAYGYTQSQYRNQLRQALEAAHYGDRKGAEGFDWSKPGCCWMARLVEHDLGIEFVPADYLQYLPDGRSVGSSVGGNRGNEPHRPDTAKSRGGLNGA